MTEPTPPADRFVQALAILRDRFGHAALRAGQEAAVRSALAGRSLLVVMPTGAGKSLLYQLPALLADGLTLVVSPLIALMKDQVDDLQQRGVPATFINSSLDLAEQQARIQRCLAGEVRLLYVAPERFQSAAFLGMLRQVKVARLAVDEAHCISEWGHDFRPDYRRLRRFRQEMRDPPVTALTATATARVQKDILESLGLAPSEVDIHVHGFDRPNLALSVAHAHDAETKTALVREFLRQEKGPGIVYVGTRRAAEELATAVADVESSVTVYHAGLEPEERTRAQDLFLSGKARVAVATLAFGMGIDKADIRFVLHYHYPGSVEQYYQEIGRAGRDGLDSRCMLLYAPADRNLR
jgi:ATP-dependent DNA helicase RecQ